MAPQCRGLWLFVHNWPSIAGSLLPFVVDRLRSPSSIVQSVSVALAHALNSLPGPFCSGRCHSLALVHVRSSPRDPSCSAQSQSVVPVHVQSSPPGLPCSDRYQSAGPQSGPCNL